MSKNKYYFVLLLLIIVTGFAGCGDNTRVSKIEDAKIAVDQRDYSKAISLLNDGSFDLKNDPEAAQLLASAHMGKAGLDVIVLIDEASKSANSGTTGTFTEFSKLLSTDPLILKEREKDTKAAVDVLRGLPNLTPDQNLQLAVAAVSDIIIFVGAELTGGFQSNGRPNEIPALSSITTPIIDRVLQDIGFMTDGIIGSGILDKDLTNDIKSIKTELGGSDGVVTAAELRDYIARI